MGIQELIEYALAHKDEKVNEIGVVLEGIFKSPYLKTYLTLLSTLDKWNDEITTKKPSIFITVKSDGDKTVTVDEYKNVADYFGDYGKLMKSIKELKAELLPHELIKAEELKPMKTEEILGHVLRSNASRSTS